MCGIVGVLTPPGAPAPPGLAQAVEELGHRGPDAAGQQTVDLGTVACHLGHTRLRILDLSPAADQPLANEDGTVWVAYNGELYNHRELRSDLERAGHRFRTRTDTEVLVHLYEHCEGDPVELLARLRGMFAFAIADSGNRRLLVARDRLGIKPLYLSRPGGLLAFSSEARPLVSAGLAGRDPNKEALAGYLLWGVVPGPATAFSDVEALAPGSYLVWEQGREQSARWWAPEQRPDPRLGPFAEGLMRAALVDAMARHVVAERPVGVFLSGGSDSTAVATLAATVGEPEAFTVTFPDLADDEGDAAAAVARRLGLAHHRVPVSGSEVAAALPQILAAMDQPTVDGVNTWLVCRAARQAGLVVALSGLGGDELFGGYTSFGRLSSVERARRLAGVLPTSSRLALARVAGRRDPGSRLARVLAAPEGAPGAYGAVRGLFSLADLPSASGRALPSLDGNEASSPATALELTHYLANQLLRDTDSMSMSHSLEVRVPLLDDTVVRVGLGLPDDVRLAPGKGLLSRASGIGPPPVKQIFALPFDRWLRGPLRDETRRALLSDSLPLAGLVPADLRRRAWQSFDEGRSHWSRPWSLAVVRLWAEAAGLGW